MKSFVRQDKQHLVFWKWTWTTWGPNHNVLADRNKILEAFRVRSIWTSKADLPQWKRQSNREGKYFSKRYFHFCPIYFFLETENQGRRRYGTHFIASLDKGGFSGPKYQFKSKIHSAHFEINISSQFFKGQKFDFGEKWKWKKSEFTIVKNNSWAVQIQPRILHRPLCHWKKCDWNSMTPRGRNLRLRLILTTVGLIYANLLLFWSI